MAPGDDDFDVEAWNRRLAETPDDPGGPATRPRRRRTDVGPAGPGSFDLTLEPGHEPRFAGEDDAAEAVAEEGFPSFAHNQWTVEGEIERFGAFGRGAARAGGWRRTVALVLVALIVLPLVLGLVELLSRVLS